MKNDAIKTPKSYTTHLWKNPPFFLKIKKRLPTYETASFFIAGIIVKHVSFIFDKIVL